MATAPLEFGVVAPRLAANGYLPVPIRPGTKRPPMAGWTRFRLDDASLIMYEHCGTGLLTGELVGIDVDALDEAAAAELRQLVKSAFGDGPVRVGQPPKFLVAYRTASPLRKRQSRTFIIDGHPSRVEVLASGQQFVCHAVHPGTGAPYRWLDANPLDIPFVDLPEVTEEQIATFLAAAEAVLGRYGTPQAPDRPAKGTPSPHHPPPNADPSLQAYVEAALADEVKRVATATAGGRNNTLNVSALNLGQLVAAGWLDRSRVERSLEDAACASGLTRDDGIGSVRATIRSGMEAGMSEPRQLPERRPTATWRDNGASAAPQPRAATVIPSPPEPAYPPPLAGEAYHGIAGQLVRVIEPHTEADPAGILIQLLVAAGNAIGRGPHCMIEATRHHTNLFAVLVGQTSKARKGTGLGWARRVTLAADPQWERCILSGLASGEGLIHAVRDARFVTDKKGQQIVEEEGIADKRLLVIEEEFARVLRVAARAGNTLSAVIRDVWDGKKILSAASKNSPSKATEAHISLVGHITSGELLDLITETDATNGIGNRFLWVFVKRSKLLPFGGNVPDLVGLTTRLATILDAARADKCFGFDQDAASVWAEVYPELSREQDGLLGAMLARGEAQVRRIALLYAALDGARSIGAAHLLAALAVWEYCEACARYVFGEELDNTVADRILGALRCAEEPVPQSNLHNQFSRNISGTRLLRALQELQRRGLVRSESLSTGGRPKTMWEATP